MQLTNEQFAKANALKEQADAYERLRDGLPENILAAWCRFVGQMREYFYMDEEWNGKELVFVPSVKAVLENDKITILAVVGRGLAPADTETTADKPQQWEIATVAEVDEIIEALVAKGLPERVMPTDNMRISPGGGRCDLCLYNRENSEKRGSVEDLAMGMALVYGHLLDLATNALCKGDNDQCQIIDIGAATPGLTAEQVTHILFPYWWTKSRFNKEA